MSHCPSEKDFIPYWDYNAPNIPNEPRDASAAAVTASALLELSGYGDKKQGRKYFRYAERILKHTWQGKEKITGLFSCIRWVAFRIIVKSTPR